MRKHPLGLLAIVIALVAAPAHAVQVPGLYEASVPVPDQSPQIREQALQQALEAVLVRVTGSTHLAQDPAVVPILARAPSLIVGYGYEALPNGQGLQLRARFDPRAVEAAVRNQGLPVWGANRLTHLVWLALRDDGGPRALLDRKAATGRAASLLGAAEARGLVLQFPEMTATERRMAEFQEAWSGQFDGIVAASRRYTADQIVVGRVGREGGRWLGRWALLDGVTVSEEWISAQDTLEETLAEGLHQLADREAQHFAVRRVGFPEDVVLSVAGIRSLRDYGRTLSYLRGLNPVQAANVERVEGDSVTFRLRVEGDPETLQRILSAGRLLQRQPVDDARAPPSYVLVR